MISADRDAVRVRIADDGRGLAAHPAGRRKPGGYGLLGMRERVETRGGEFWLREGAGRRGVIVEAVLPASSASDAIESDRVAEISA